MRVLQEKDSHIDCVGPEALHSSFDDD